MLPAEARLLFLADGRHDRDGELASVVAGGLEWDLVCALAEREMATPILAQHLARLPDGGVPAAALARIRRMARVTRFKMLYLEQRIGETTAALRREGIDGVLLKGAALGASVYSSLVDRPMIDVDVLVPRDRVEDALATLLATGWMWRPDRARDGDYDHLHHLPALLDARGMEVSLELHTSLLPPGQPFALTARDILAGAVDAPRSSLGGRIPSAEHLLLHACIHFAWAHLMRKGAWRTFRDVRALLLHHDYDWHRFGALSDTSRARTCCYWTLRLARGIGGIDVPEAALAALRPPLPEVVLSALERHFALILLPTVVDCPSVTLRRVLWSAGILPAWSGHGANRPWVLLALDGETRRKRAAAAPAASRARGVGEGRWRRYWRGLALASVSGPDG